MGLQKRFFKVNDEQFDHYYLCNYKPKATGSDKLSKSLLRFKNGWDLHVAAWIACALLEIGKIPLRKGSLIVRALGSHEEIINSHQYTSLDHLGSDIGHEYEGVYQPRLLRKNRRTRKIKSLPWPEREQELQNVYSFTGNTDQENGILILDDILTTGTTMCAIVSAIRKILPHCPILLFTLAYTHRQALLNKTVQLRSHPYSWKPEVGWTLAEEPAIDYTELDKLKCQILKDSFN